MDIQCLINKFQLSLETEYVDIITRSEINVVSKNLFTVNYCNERSLSYFSEKFIEENFPSFGLNIDFLINEYLIKLEESSLSSIPDFSDDIEGVKDESKSMFIPDCCFSLNKETYYLEFKVCSSLFSYIKLASDYLKFKHYTFNSTVPAYFIYVNFTKDMKGSIHVPTIRYDMAQEPKYQFISSKLKSSDIDTNARIFIAKTEKQDGDYNNTNEELVRTLDEIVKNSRIFSEADGDEKFAATDPIDTNVFYSAKGVLGSKVILSNFVKNHIDLINMLYDYFEEHASELLGPNFKLRELEYDDFVNASKYFNNIIKNLTEKYESNINEASYNVSYKKSYWIIYLLKKFCENYQLTIFDSFSLSNEKVQKDYELLMNDIDFFHKYDKSKEFTYLCFKLTYLIHNLYSFLYEKDEVGKLTIRQEALSSKQKSKVINCLEGIKTSIGYRKREKISYDNPIEIKKIVLSILELALN